MENIRYLFGEDIAVSNESSSPIKNVRDPVEYVKSLYRDVPCWICRESGDLDSEILDYCQDDNKMVVTKYTTNAAKPVTYWFHPYCLERCCSVCKKSIGPPSPMMKIQSDGSDKPSFHVLLHVNCRYFCDMCEKQIYFNLKEVNLYGGKYRVHSLCERDLLDPLKGPRCQKCDAEIGSFENATLDKKTGKHSHIHCKCSECERQFYSFLTIFPTPLAENGERHYKNYAICRRCFNSRITNSKKIHDDVKKGSNALCGMSKCTKLWESDYDPEKKRQRGNFQYCCIDCSNWWKDVINKRKY